MLLHIIFLILKIIGCILLVVLGLLVLLILFALFTPLRYIAEGSCGGDVSSLDVHAHLNILFHLIGADIRYEKEKLSWDFHIAWKHFGNTQTVETEEIKIETDRTDETESRSENADGSEKRTSIEYKKSKPENDSKKKNTIKPERIPKEETVIKPENTKYERPSDTKAESEKSENFHNQDNHKNETAMEDKVENFFEKIKCTFQKTCAKIKLLMKKKDKLLDFLTDEIHKNAFTRTLAEFKKMMRRLKPKRLEMDICFGFEDPSVTGNILALYCMVYPSLGEYVNVTPDFQKKILKGNLFIKGHIRAGIFAAFGLNLIRNKNVRKTFQHIRKFKLSE